MLSRCFSDFSVSVGVFVIGLSQISSFSLLTLVMTLLLTLLSAHFQVRRCRDHIAWNYKHEPIEINICVKSINVLYNKIKLYTKSLEIA